MIFKLCNLLLLLTLSSTVAAQAPPDCQTKQNVTTQSGSYCGLLQRGTQAEVRSYLGIKYATAERWQAPKPYIDQSGMVIKATQVSPMCPQKNVDLADMSEDCLYLNIWVPKGISEAADLPVLLFIHGGAFVFGSGGAKLFNGINFSERYKAVVVTFNYRLGAFGFLAPDKPTETGNYGILDQIEAVKWVHRNIKAFGGNPDNITLVGQSAGAMSVGILIGTEQMKPYIRRAIMESNPFGIPYKSYRVAKDIASDFRKKCPDNCSIEQILSASSMVTIKTLPSLLRGFDSILTWSPYVDGQMIKQQPLEKSITIPVIIGTNQDEGIQFINPVAGILNGVKYRAFLKLLFDYSTEPEDEKISQTILSKPRYSIRGDQSPFDALQHLITDYLFTCPNRYALEKANNTLRYGYFFSYLSSYNNWPSVEMCSSNICHSDELPFVFQNEIIGQTGERPEAGWTLSDQYIAKILGNYWSNFIYNGHLSQAIIPWQAYNEGGKRLEIERPQLVKMIDYEAANCDFWDQIGYQHEGNFYLRDLVNKPTPQSD